MKLVASGKDTYVYTNNKAIDPAKPSVVFIHGAGFDHSVWTLFARHFSRHDWNVIALDLPGHGRSEGPVLESIEAMASWSIALIDTLGLNSVALVGHSMGSLITLETASRLGDRVTHAVLIGSISPMPVSDPILDATANKPGAAPTGLPVSRPTSKVSPLMEKITPTVRGMRSAATATPFTERVASPPAAKPPSWA